MNTKDLKEEYINTHRHDWTIHQEADFFIAKFQAREDELIQEIVKRFYALEEIEKPFELNQEIIRTRNDITKFIKSNKLK